MSKKTPQPFVIGKWEQDEKGTRFVPGSAQPPEPITDLQSAIRWAKDAYKNLPGDWSFIRDIPGALTIGVQQVFQAKWAE